MATEEPKVPSEPAASSEQPAAEMVTVTVKEDCNLLINGQSTALTAGQEVDMPKDEAASYAHLGLVELKAGPAASAEGSGVPKRK